MKRIEIYTNFQESEEATLLMYLNMTPVERWVKAHELSNGVKSDLSATFSLTLSKDKEINSMDSDESD